MAFSIKNYVSELLKANPETKFTARQIANWIFETYPAECEEKRRKSKAKAIPLTTDEALIQQIVAEIGSQRPIFELKIPGFQTTEERPRKYFISTRSDDGGTDDSSGASDDPLATNVSARTQSEHDLYPVLSQYLLTELSVYSKRIDEKRSKNSRGRGGNMWLFPDVVGFEDLSSRWNSEVRLCSKEASDRRTRLWSFEVKKHVNGANVREAYFQAVRNSTWANFGYLVANDVTGSNTMRELRVLAGLHGVGVIRLNDENPTESEIIIPSIERATVDWETANRIAEENEDFVDYLRNVRHFYQTGDIVRPNWFVGI